MTVQPEARRKKTRPRLRRAEEISYGAKTCGLEDGWLGPRKMEEVTRGNQAFQLILLHIEEIFFFIMVCTVRRISS